MTLTEFLLARIAEDETNLSGHVFDHKEWDTGVVKCRHPSHIHGYAAICWRAEVSARVLAECEAKRRIIELHHPKEPDGCDAWNDGRCIVCVKFHADMDCEQMAYPCPTIRALAQPYADHPDFDPEWKL